MEPVKLKGRVNRVIDESGMTQSGKGWKKRTVIVDTGSKFSNLAPVTFFGDKVSQANVSEGEQVEVTLFLGGREYNGKYYPDLSGDKIEVLGKGSVPSAPPVEPATITNGSNDDDLPF